MTPPRDARSQRTPPQPGTGTPPPPRPAPAPSRAPAPRPPVAPRMTADDVAAELLFCAVCQVSIAAAEVERGDAMRTPRGRTFCAVCAHATPEERDRRRTALEVEFADDAPVPRPAVRRATTPRPAAQAIAAPPPAPPANVLDARVGELERAAFRMQSRITNLEERLDVALRQLAAGRAHEG